MARWKITAGAFALGIVLAAAASPVLAKTHMARGQDWRNARAQAIPDSDITLSGARAEAVRECNDKAAPLVDYTWGDDQMQRYRSCMAERGQIE